MTEQKKSNDSNDAPILAHATAREQGAFARMYERFPPKLQKLASENGLTFTYDYNAKLTPSDPKNIVIQPRRVKIEGKDVVGMHEVHIFGQILATLLPPDSIPSQQWKDAYDELMLNSLPPNTPKTQAIRDELINIRTSRNYFESASGIEGKDSVLAAAYQDFVLGGNNVQSKLSLNILKQACETLGIDLAPHKIVPGVKAEGAPPIPSPKIYPTLVGNSNQQRIFNASFDKLGPNERNFVLSTHCSFDLGIPDEDNDFSLSAKNNTITLLQNHYPSALGERTDLDSNASEILARTMANFLPLPSKINANLIDNFLVEQQQIVSKIRSSNPSKQSYRPLSASQYLDTLKKVPIKDKIALALAFSTTIKEGVEEKSFDAAHQELARILDHYNVEMGLYLEKHPPKVVANTITATTNTPNPDQTIIPARTSVNLEGANSEQQALFDEAFASIPDNIQKIILHKNLKFKFKQVDHKKTSFSIKIDFPEPNTISFNSSAFFYPKIGQQAFDQRGRGGALNGIAKAIVAGSLVELFDPEVSDENINRLIGVNPDGTNKKSDPKTNGMEASVDNKIESIIMKSIRALASASRKQKIANILQSEYFNRYIAKEPEVVADEKALELSKLQAQIYDSCLQKADEFLANLERLKTTYVASETAFAINREPEGLTHPQQQYFDKLNEVLSLLEISPVDFDLQFKRSAQHLSAILTRDAFDKAGQRYNEHTPFNQAKSMADFGTLPEMPKGRFIDYSGSVNSKRKAEKHLVNNTIRHLLAETMSQSAGIFDTLSVDISSDANAQEREAMLYLTENGQRIVDEYSPNKNKLTLQNIASGEVNHYFLSGNRPGVNTGVGRYQITSPVETLFASVHNAALRIAERKELTPEVKQKLTDTLQEMKALWPDFMKSKQQLQQEIKDDLDRRARQQAAQIEAITEKGKEQAELLRKQEEAQRRAEEEALRPKLYVLPGNLLGIDHELVHQELKPLCQMLDQKDPALKTLGDALINDKLSPMYIALAKGQEGVFRSLLDVGKNPAIKITLETARKSVENFFALPLDDSNKDKHEIYASIRQHLLQSPVLLSVLTGNVRVVSEAAKTALEDSEFRELYTKSDLLPKYWERLAEFAAPAELKAIKDAQEQREKERQAAIERAKEAASHPPEPSPEAPIEDILPAMVPVAAAAAVAATQPTPAMAPAPVDISDATTIPISPQVSEAIERKEAALTNAYYEMEAQAETWLIDMFDKGFTRFRCDMDLKDGNYKITLTFANAAGETKEYELKSHPKHYKDQNLVIGLDDAVQLKMAIESYVLNHEDIEPLRGRDSKGHVIIEASDVIPFMANEDKYRKVSATSSNGLVAAQIEAPDRVDKHGKPKGDPFKVTFQLGVADDALSLTENPDVKERLKVILDYIAENSVTDNGKRKCFVTKQQVMDHLREWAQQNNKPWVERTSLKLDDFDEPQTIYNVTGEHPQTIILGPLSLALEPGGVNPSWIASFTISTQNGQSEPKKAFRGCSLRLHTSDESLAKSRATKSVVSLLNDIKTKLDNGENRSKPWVIANKNEQIAGGINIQDFLDDMPRYEDAVKIKLEHQATIDGKLHLTLRTYRGTIPNLSANIPTQNTEEPIRYSASGVRVPTETTIIVPPMSDHEIENFVHNINREAGFALAQEFASHTILDDIVKRRTVPVYNPNTIKNAFAAAIVTEIERRFHTIVNPKTLFPTESPATSHAESIGQSSITSPAPMRA